MGREVMSAYRRRNFSTSLSPSRSSSATNSSMESLADATVTVPSNLTPQRKHHKLLKDGSEVWSKDVEKIFVEGLRQYWQSPWATYSRGRSRWRNQFLVDHLKRAGIERTKKQVASHIQVLRNMWRGTPEFHLVAGGEELFQENGLLAHTNKKPTPAPSETPAPHMRDLPDTSAGSSSSSSTPEFSALDFPLELQTASSFPTLPLSAHMSSFSDLALDDGLGTAMSPLTESSFGALSSSPHAAHLAPLNVKLEPLAMDPTLFSLPQGAYVDGAHSTTDYAPHIPVPPPNRIMNLHFWAEGMVPLSVDVDRLVGSTPAMPARIFLHFRVSMPPVADLRVPPALQGVGGAVSFAARWASLAKCQTKSWGAGRTVVSQELGLFAQVPTPEVQAGPNDSPQLVFAYLPDSALSRCHWLDTVQTITQQVVVDNEVLAVLVYHIERVADAARTTPAMELIGFQKYPWRGAQQPHQPQQQQHSQHPHHHHHPHMQQHSPHAFTSPPVSPTSPSFSGEYPSAPVSPTSPMFNAQGAISNGGVDGMMPYHFQHPPFEFHSR
ncbi:uncharacterized protein TRAVEDRAFT_45713 [Trametes versicolor FP-101664 SS1]|uniref:uncharacterized protein n=1 Tax=Trametes versicolor (strain FP-101664) TaxID=717944 RepID=UPI0004623634|nr:uncharacterized protein TRAVEDRAFT_45713 [Trametes versicolor FP-101664 SS1]EIW60467.1 hypothetical protein TRAVEDRAFT_45713 [Trametes versicolor FP-101664 SS1]